MKCIKYPVTCCPRNFLSSLCKVRNSNCTYSSSKMERGSKIIHIIKWKQQCCTTNKNFPWTTTFWERVIEISISCFYNKCLEQRVGKTVRKFADQSLPSPDTLTEAQVHLTRATCCPSQEWMSANRYNFGCHCCRNEYWLRQISSASQAIQQSSLSLLPWAMKHSQKWVSEQLDIWKMYSQQGCIEGVGLIGRFSSKSDNFGDTENHVDCQCSWPAEKKKQVASKWLKSTVEPSRILVLFLAAADKILVLKHFFFFFYLPVLEICHVVPNGGADVLQTVVCCVCWFSTGSSVPRHSVEAMPICKREYRILWPKKAQTSVQLVGGGRTEFWKPTATTQFYPAFAWHQNDYKFWEQALGYRNPSFLGSACVTAIAFGAPFSFPFCSGFCSLHLLGNL